MDSREREKFLVAGGVAFIILLVIAILASQVLGRKSDLESAIVKKQRNLATIKRLAGDYIEASQRLKNLEAKLGGDSPVLSYVEGLTRKAGIQKPALKVLRATPTDYFEETSVEIKAKSLNLRQTITLLKMVENSPRYLRIKYFHIKTPYSKPELMDITLHLSAYSKKSETKPTEEEAG